MIINDLYRKFASCHVLWRLILLNVGAIVLLRLVWIVSEMCGSPAVNLLQWVGVPSQGGLLLSRPWTPLTYMFAHFSLIHIFVNMLWLYWVGKLFLHYFNTKQLVALYVLGGLGGALIYVGGYALLPISNALSTPLIGASASVFAIALAIAVYAPNHKIRFFFFIEPFSLKWLVAVMVVMMFLGNGTEMVGSHLAHLGGALVGVLYGWQMQKGHDITAWLNQCFDAIANMANRFKRAPGQPIGGTKFRGSASASSASSPRQAPSEQEIDIILAKLKRSGYGALTEHEKAILFQASQK